MQKSKSTFKQPCTTDQVFWRWHLWMICESRKDSPDLGAHKAASTMMAEIEMMDVQSMQMYTQYRERFDRAKSRCSSRRIESLAHRNPTAKIMVSAKRILICEGVMKDIGVSQVCLAWFRVSTIRAKYASEKTRAHRQAISSYPADRVIFRVEYSLTHRKIAARVELTMPTATISLDNVTG